MMPVTTSAILVPHVGTQEDLGAPKVFGERRRSSALDMTLVTVDPNLKEGYQVVEQVPTQAANLQAFSSNQAVNRVIHTAPSDENPLVCVVGVGFVGEILLKEFGSVFPSIGFDISAKRLENLAPDFTCLKNVRLSSETSILKEATHFCISVPTLLRPEDNSIDTSHLIRAIAVVTTHARPGSTIVIESSVSVGMTRTLLGPFTSKFHCGMSPERVDPGRTLPAAHEIPKIISALTEPALLSMHKVYSQAFKTVVPVSKPEVAEMTKLYENCYRMVNIAFVNEVADACVKQGIEVDEVVNAAGTKPFGFQGFTPGLGVGGHCIPINPFYLMANNDLPLLKSATTATWDRPKIAAREFIVNCKERLNGAAPRVLVIGVGFKPGQKVVDCSPAVAFARELMDKGLEDVVFYDPLVEQELVPWLRKLPEEGYFAEKVDEAFDAVAICTRQEKVDWLVVKSLKRAAVVWY